MYTECFVPKTSFVVSATTLRFIEKHATEITCYYWNIYENDIDLTLEEATQSLRDLFITTVDNSFERVLNIKVFEIPTELLSVTNYCKISEVL